jgi:hypothetical protein
MQVLPSRKVSRCKAGHNSSAAYPGLLHTFGPPGARTQDSSEVAPVQPFLLNRHPSMACCHSGVVLGTEGAATWVGLLKQLGMPVVQK